MSRTLPGFLALAAVWSGAVGAASAPVLERDGCIVLEDFSTDTPGRFPSRWKARTDEGQAVYSVREEGGIRHLHAASNGLGIQAAREVTWDLDTYPILAWSWRPVEFPRGADERERRTNDSPLAVYFLVDHSRVRGPRAVKYIWSEKVPVGTSLTTNMGLTQVRLLRSGAVASPEWVEERVDVRADYRRLFGQSATPTPAGIGVLTDADDTASSARGDYAAFRACRRLSRPSAGYPLIAAA